MGSSAEVLLDDGKWVPIGWMGQRNPNHQLIGGKHPMIYRVSTIQGVWEMGYESGHLYDIHVFWLMKQ